MRVPPFGMQSGDTYTLADYPIFAQGSSERSDLTFPDSSFLFFFTLRLLVSIQGWHDDSEMRVPPFEIQPGNTHTAADDPSFTYV